jgi:Ca-activated chloride channel family protein
MSDPILPASRLLLLLSLLGLSVSSLFGQVASDDQAVPPEPAPERSAMAEPKNPYDAYEAGYYDRALEGFLDQEVDRPDDERVRLNQGNALYKLKDFERAAGAYQAVAGSESTTDDQLRAQAMYNLGNTAYRQGKLPEAVEAYKKSLDLDPDDQDAKFNLEFVKREIERRQQQQDQQSSENQQQDDQQQDDQQQQDQQQDGEKQDDQKQDGESGEDQQESEPSDGDQQQEQQPGEDSDQDGLSDQQEREAENPTDPQNPDSDGDGLADGQEDQNRNGRVDPGETDPNQRDSDGDGTPDGQEAGAETGQPGESQPGEVPEGLTEEQAQAYLDALQEGRPDREVPKGKRGKAKSGKDW